MADLRSIAQELYGRPLSEFIAARKHAADGAGAKDLAKQVKALRKPSAAAWAVNALARERAELVEEVVELGDQLRDAQSDSDGSRTRLLDRARRDLTRQALDEAAELAKASGGSLSAQAAADVEETLRAAMTDPDAANAVQDGLLVTTFAANPFEPVDLTDVVAIPPEGARPRTKKVQQGPTQLERKRIEAAEAKVEKARRKAKTAEGELETLIEEREELQDELVELRRKAKAIEREIGETEKALDRADSAADRAEEAERAAQRALEDAEAELDRLR
jgi:chromosome segregation ATPase